MVRDPMNLDYAEQEIWRNGKAEIPFNFNSRPRDETTVGTPALTSVISEETLILMRVLVLVCFYCRR